MPVFNGEASLCQALDSLLAQDYPNLELIISNNASTDNTKEICLEYGSRDSRISYYWNSVNIGAPANFNQVFSLAHGKYFMWASHDDYRKPSYISACVEAFGLSDKVVLAGTACDCVDPQGNLLMIDRSLTTVGMSTVQRFMRYKRILHDYDKHRGGITYGVFKREALAKLMPLQKAMTADQNMMLELSLMGEFVTVQERLFTRRMSGPSNSGNSLKALARSYGITNPFLIYGAYVTREIEIWKMVGGSRELNVAQKVWLIVWSFFHTGIAVGMRILSLGYRRLDR